MLGIFVRVGKNIINFKKQYFLLRESYNIHFNIHQKFS